MGGNARASPGQGRRVPPAFGGSFHGGSIGEVFGIDEYFRGLDDFSSLLFAR